MNKIDWKYLWRYLLYLYCCMAHGKAYPIRAEGGRAYECSRCFTLHKVPYADRSDLVPPRQIFVGYEERPARSVGEVNV